MHNRVVLHCFQNSLPYPVCVCIHIYIYIYIYTKRSHPSYANIKTHNLCLTHLFCNVTCMLNVIICNMLLDVLLDVNMGTLTYKSMFGVQHGHMAFQIDVCLFFPKWSMVCFKSMLAFPHGNMICQVDVGFPKWEHDFPNRCWMSIHA